MKHINSPSASGIHRRSREVNRLNSLTSIWVKFAAKWVKNKGGGMFSKHLDFLAVDKVSYIR